MAAPTHTTETHLRFWRCTKILTFILQLVINLICSVFCVWYFVQKKSAIKQAENTTISNLICAFGIISACNLIIVAACLLHETKLKNDRPGKTAKLIFKAVFWMGVIITSVFACLGFVLLYLQTSKMHLPSQVTTENHANQFPWMWLTQTTYLLVYSNVLIQMLTQGILCKLFCEKYSPNDSHLEIESNHNNNNEIGNEGDLRTNLELTCLDETGDKMPLPVVKDAWTVTPKPSMLEKGTSTSPYVEAKELQNESKNEIVNDSFQQVSRRKRIISEDQISNFVGGVATASNVMEITADELDSARKRLRTSFYDSKCKTIPKILPIVYECTDETDDSDMVIRTKDSFERDHDEPEDDVFGTASVINPEPSHSQASSFSIAADDSNISTGSPNDKFSHMPVSIRFSDDSLEQKKPDPIESATKSKKMGALNQNMEMLDRCGHKLLGQRKAILFPSVDTSEKVDEGKNFSHQAFTYNLKEDSVELHKERPLRLSSSQPQETNDLDEGKLTNGSFDDNHYGPDDVFNTTFTINTELSSSLPSISITAVEASNDSTESHNETFLPIPVIRNPNDSLEREKSVEPMESGTEFDIFGRLNQKMEMLDRCGHKLLGQRKQILFSSVDISDKGDNAAGNISNQVFYNNLKTDNVKIPVEIPSSPLRPSSAPSVANQSISGDFSDWGGISVAKKFSSLDIDEIIKDQDNSTSIDFDDSIAEK